MKQQQTKKFNSILSGLMDAILEFNSFCNDTAILAAEWKLAQDYENMYYDTEVTIRENLTATVYQTRIGYYDALKDLDKETIDKITKGEIDIDDVVTFQPVMDYHPFPGVPYYLSESINEIPKSNSWDLSKFEVTTHLSSIICPSFKDYLKTLKFGIAAIKKLGINNSTTVETLGLLKLLYDQGKSIYAAYIERIEKKRPQLPDMFIDEFMGYLSVYLDQTTIGRLEEFPIRIGFESTNKTQSKNTKMTMGKVNRILCKLIPDLSKSMDYKKITIRLLANEIGCSTGLISKCPMWQAFVKQRDKRQKTSSKTQRLNEVHLDSLKSNEPEPIEKLIAEQKADMSNQNSSNKIYPDR